MSQKDIYRYSIKNYNITCGEYIGNSNHLAIYTDEGFIKKFGPDNNPYATYEMDKILKEMVMFKQSKLMVCATQATDKNNTSCLRVFYDINTKGDYFDVPSHFGDTTRVRINYDENLIFSTGADGCLNVYSVEAFQDIEENERLFFEKFSDNYTSTVLIKKSKLKEKELEKIDLPEKRFEKYKKTKSENAEKLEKLKKDLDAIKNNLAMMKQTEMKLIGQKKNELDSLKNEYEQKINKIKTQYQTEFEKTMNNFQIELAGKSREVEKIREAYREHKNNHKEEINNLRREHDEKRSNLEKEFDKQISNLQNHKTQLHEKIKMLDHKKDLDSDTIDWLNNRIVQVIQQNIEELKKGIEDLTVHNAHQIKKLKEEQEKLKTTAANLEFELKQIDEEKVRQENNRRSNSAKKKNADVEMKQIQDRINEVENKIIEGKKRKQYLEKCKFVLDYKIKELKKEMGPIEKAIEDLKKRTKDLDVELEKFNREHDIINKRLVDFKDLQTKMYELGFEERKEQTDIREFKTLIFQMVNNIDDYDFLRDGFRKLRDKYSYKPDFQSLDLDAEFYNQKDNMRKNVNDLQDQLRNIKINHVESIEKNRKDNHGLIERIDKLKRDISAEKKEKKSTCRR